MKNLSATKARVIEVLWRELEDREISLQEVERRLGKKTGWLWNRRRYGFDVGDFFDVLRAAGINFVEFLDKAFPGCDRVPPLSEVAAQILAQANVIVETENDIES